MYYTLYECKVYTTDVDIGDLCFRSSPPRTSLFVLLPDVQLVSESLVPLVALAIMPLRSPLLALAAAIGTSAFVI